MPLTTANFWFEELRRVKTVPPGTDPEVLTKYAPKPGAPPNVYFLVRKLPLSDTEPALGVFYFYNVSGDNGGSAWMCADFITQPARFRDATVELVHRLMRVGLTLDDGAVMLPVTRSAFAALPVQARAVPPELLRGGVRPPRGERARVDTDRLRAAPETRKAVISAAMASTFIAGEMDHPLVLDTEISAVDADDSDDDVKTITLRYSWRGR